MPETFLAQLVPYLPATSGASSPMEPQVRSRARTASRLDRLRAIYSVFALCDGRYTDLSALGCFSGARAAAGRTAGGMHRNALEYVPGRGHQRPICQQRPWCLFPNRQGNIETSEPVVHRLNRSRAYAVSFCRCAGCADSTMTLDSATHPLLHRHSNAIPWCRHVDWQPVPSLLSANTLTRSLTTVLWHVTPIPFDIRPQKANILLFLSFN